MLDSENGDCRGRGLRQGAWTLQSVVRSACGYSDEDDWTKNGYGVRSCLNKYGWELRHIPLARCRHFLTATARCRHSHAFAMPLHLLTACMFRRGQMGIGKGAQHVWDQQRQNQRHDQRELAYYFHTESRNLLSCGSWAPATLIEAPASKPNPGRSQDSSLLSMFSGIQKAIASYPRWLHILAWVYIAICLACALGIAIHIVARPQKMWIMRLVWPITALYMGPFATYVYRRSLPVLEKKPFTPG